MNSQCSIHFWIFLSAVLTVTAKQYSLYSGPQPTARHKNHCAYVVEKTVSYTIQDGATPYMKPEYNKCTWGQKCPPNYRMFYKPMYKVAHKTVSELEWKCCPGYAGVGCTAAYGMKTRPTFKGPMPGQKGPMPNFRRPMPVQKGPMPPFKGSMPLQKAPMPSYKGPMPAQKGPMPSYKGPMPAQKGPMPSYKGPMPAQKGPMQSYKGPVPAQKGPMPSYKGPMPAKKGPMPSYKGPRPAQKGPMPSFKGPYNSQQGPMSSFEGQMNQPSFNGNPWYQPQAPSDRMTVYPIDHQAPEAEQTEPSGLPVPQDPGLELTPEEQETVTDFQDPLSDHHRSALEDSEPVPIAQMPSSGGETNRDHNKNSVEDERLNRIEEEVLRLSLGLETLRGTVTGLEDSLRASLREDANRMLNALISAAPGTISSPSFSRDSTIGFGDLPGGAPEMEGSDVMGHLPNLADFADKLSELQEELVVKTSELVELRGTVMYHNNTLNRLSDGTLTQPNVQKAVETLVESKMSEAQVAILDGFKKHVESAEQRCESQVAELRLRCKEDLLTGQDRFEQVLDERAEGLRTELQKLQSQLYNLEPEDGCCIAVSGLTERIIYLEHSVDGLNESQIHLGAELGGHKDHIEGMLEGRLGYVEAKLNIETISQEESNVSKRELASLKSQMEEKLKAFESRLLASVEELSNLTAPALLEGQVMPTLETEVELLRKRMEEDLSRVQNDLKSMELICTRSCVPQPVLTGYGAPLETTQKKSEEKGEDLNEKFDMQAERLNRINTTLYNLLVQLAEKQEEAGLQAEVTLLKVNVNSVNKSLCGLQESIGSMIKEVGNTNLTWQEREERLAKQVKGMVQLVGRQATMLGSGDRKLNRLKGELQELRRRVNGELQGCRSTALDVQKEVTEVGGRVARVEGQCGGLAHLADDLERIRGELERHTDLSQLNSTLVSHSQQLSDLRDSLQNCIGSSGITRIADDIVLEPTHPRGDQFAVPPQHRGI